MIGAGQLLPQVIGEFPGTRQVFDRYGLHGCGGALGPHETVEFFARVHGVPLPALLKELEAARQVAPVEYVEDLEDVLYRRYFRAAIVMFVGVGGLLGAVTLVLQAFGVTSARFWSMTQAHADVQLFGWIGLFVMGFACQGLPRFKYVKLWRPILAQRAFVLVTAGLVIRTLAVLPWRWAEIAGAGGSVVVAVGALTFGTVIFRTLAASTARDAWDRYVIAGLTVFVAGAVMAPFFLLLIASPAWIAAWRDMLLLGFGGLTILGVGQRILPAAFGFRSIGARASAAGFVLAVLGVAVLGAGATAQRPWISTASALLFGTGSLALGAGFRIHALRPEGRSTKFLCAAWGWLLVSMLLLAAEGPAHSWLGLSTIALHSAFRHAFALGFLSLTIVGVSLKVVPVLGGRNPAGLPPLRGTFVMINAAILLRVAGLIGMEWGGPGAVTLAAISGPLLLLAFGVWGVHLWSLMKPVRRETEAPGLIGPDSRVARIAELHPGTLEVFDRFGFRELRNPLLRATLARGITVRMACGMKGVNMDEFLRELRNRAGRETPPPPGAHGAKA